ncbi:MAG TPA: PKD domain-containing protein [Solirubrobacterales bacterium]|nr:PKD domain-containing protein [Solirubrobacterales bacterium]
MRFPALAHGLDQVALPLVVLALLAGVFAGSARAQTAYVANPLTESVTAFDSDTLLPAPTIPVASQAADVAISPDARTAYVTGYSTGEVLMVDTATETVIGSIPGFGNPVAIAISPDGGTLYVSDAGSYTILTASTATGAVTGSPIDVGGWATGLAVSPGGDTLYASVSETDAVVPVDAATRAVGDPIEVGDEPDHLRLTPDGSKLYVPNTQSNSVSVIDTATETVLDEVEVGLYPERVVPSPDGKRVYVINHGWGEVSVIDTGTDEILGEPAKVVDGPDGAAITADGRRLLVMGGEADRPQAIDTATMTRVGAPPQRGTYAEGMAILPAQTPVPELSAVAAKAGAASTFDASASSIYDGRIARYDWDFGDGTSAIDGGPKPTHVYATGGSYRVTVTVSNGQGCPGFIFTGQTAICAGPSTASVSEQVSVGDPEATPIPPAAWSPLAVVTDPRSVRVQCPSAARRGGCKFALQLVSGRPKRLPNGKLKNPKPQSAVVKLTLTAGKSAQVVLSPKPKFAARLASQSRVFVKRTRVMRGKTRTDFPRLAFVG